MDIKSILRNIKNTVLLLGPPGIGKTENVKEFAIEDARDKGYTEIFNGHFDNSKKYFIEYDDKYFDLINDHRENFYVFMDIRMVEYEPTDVSGIPQKNENYFKYLPPSWVVIMSRGDGLLFFDEITNVSRPDQLSVLYKLLYDRRAGFVKLSDNVKIVAAGNDPNSSSIANLLPLPLVSRMAVVNVNPPTVYEWIDYMNRKYTNWNKRIATFLMHRSFKQFFIKIPQVTETLEPYPTPRSWTYAALHDERYIESFVGKEAGSTYSQYVKHIDEIPDIEKLLSDFTLYDKLTLDAKYLLTTGLADYFSEKKNSDVLDFLAYIADKEPEIVAVVLKLINDGKTVGEIVMRNPSKYKKIIEVGKRLSEYL